MIIFINGASSAGKTSLARALQEKWKGPLLYWSIDTVISQLPFALTGKGVDASEGFPLTSIKTQSDMTPSIEVGRIGRDLTALSAQYVKLVAESGYDVVVDYVLLDEEMYETFRSEFADVEAVFVGLTCSLKALSQREGSRGDRESGLSVNQERRVHFCRTRYDYELDSTKIPAEALATMVIKFIADHEVTKGLGDTL